jgi:protein-L-isoaspartate(D-aspartate) O-methyltransferase
MTNLDNYFTMARQEMVAQIEIHTTMVSDHIHKSALAENVMEVIGAVPRHEFVPAELQTYAYLNQPLPIGFGKTISQPFIVALMTDLLDIQSGDRILEIGTGLGYQAAVLAELAQQIYTVEIIQELAQEAASRLLRQGYYNVAIGVADGSRGWPDHAPYDKIIVTAAPELIPVAFFNQLKTGGKMVVPAGFETAQQLMLVEKDDDGAISTEEILPVRFSPLTVTH